MPEMHCSTIDTGLPLQSVNIHVYDASGRRVAGAFSDASGNYVTSPGLATGSHKLQFTTSGGIPYLGKYYADKADLATATLIEVTSPATRSGIDAELAPGARISGRVTDAITGVGLAGFQVTICGSDGYIDTDYTDPSGNYSTNAGLATGTYEVTFGPSSETSDYIAKQQPQAASL